MEKLLQPFLALALTAALAACGTDSGSSGGSSGTSDGDGSGFSLRLTDAPFDDAARVDITFTEVRLKKVSGGWVTIPVNAANQKINLAALQGTKSEALLSGEDVDADDYEELRLIVSTAAMANTIELSSGGVVELKIPGGSSGLKINGNFSISDMRPTSMVVDIDLRQSIIKAGPNYIMRPVLRLIDGDNFGHVRGKVDSALLTAPSCSDAQVDTFNAVYVYVGHNVSPDDINQRSNLNVDPITTTNITYDTTTSEYMYEAAFLPLGDYTIAFTCNSDLDDLDADDNLQFFNIQNVTVQVNDTMFL
ncbi:MAG: DUF4382 domain-containing protein [Gammaproteobacteria bacterium]|nr:MAG: DUF4382 domain-containing protein [Gammaproteobacteria bacterium]